MEKYYYIIDVRPGRYSGYSFCVRVTNDENPDNYTRFTDWLVKKAAEMGLFEDERDQYGCGVSSANTEDEIGNWKDGATEIDISDY